MVKEGFDVGGGGIEEGGGGIEEGGGGIVEGGVDGDFFLIAWEDDWWVSVAGREDLDGLIWDGWEIVLQFIRQAEVAIFL